MHGHYKHQPIKVSCGWGNLYLLWGSYEGQKYTMWAKLRVSFIKAFVHTITAVNVRLMQYPNQRCRKHHYCCDEKLRNFKTTRKISKYPSKYRGKFCGEVGYTGVIYVRYQLPRYFSACKRLHTYGFLGIWKINSGVPLRKKVWETIC